MFMQLKFGVHWLSFEFNNRPTWAATAWTVPAIAFESPEDRASPSISIETRNKSFSLFIKSVSGSFLNCNAEKNNHNFNFTLRWI